MNTKFAAANIFEDVKVESFPRHAFNISYTNSFTCNHGLAYPCLVKHVSPGDKVDVSSFGRVQLQPLATATMQNITCYVRYFYVPFRLLWNDWDKFIAQDGFVETPLLAPYYQLNSANLNVLNCNLGTGGLMDFLNYGIYNFDENNIPIRYSTDAKLQFTVFRHLAYWKIWDRYFRDENIQNTICPEPDEVVAGYNNHPSNLDVILPVAWEKDYFTTALPWTQKGQPINIGTMFQVEDPTFFLKEKTGGQHNVKLTGYSYGLQNGSYSNIVGSTDSKDDPEGSETDVWAIGDLMLNTANLNSQFSINDLRYANALQRYLERLALGGNRPAEFYLSMYGVKVDDLRIGDPYYLGGGKSYVNVTPVTQQSQTTTGEGGSPQGTLAGNGNTSVDMSFNEPYYCQEFGIIMGIFYIRPELNYTQGIPRETQLFSHLDYYNPIFAHLGEEPVLKSELVFGRNTDNTSSESNNDQTFGYQSRYAYLKHSRNEVHGDLKSTLSSWLLSYHWNVNNGLPSLNSDFITVDQNYDIFAADDAKEHHYIVEMHHKFQKESSMPDFSIPSL